MPVPLRNRDRCQAIREARDFIRTGAEAGWDQRELEKWVGLKLVSSGDDRALVIRDHVLGLVRRCGTLEIQRGPVRVITLRMYPWAFIHWTPFSELSSEEASSPGYRHALERQHTRPDLRYGLEVWHGTKVLSVLWADQGGSEVLCFVRGPWEAEALAL